MRDLFYRLSQFWHALTARPGRQDLEQVRALLKPAEMELFAQMQPGEQAHSICVMRKVQALEGKASRQPDSDLLVAALLHDVGKICFPLRLYERALIVLGKAWLPGYAAAWGQSQASGWRRMFVVAEQHPEWGASMARAAGSSPRVVELIHFHQTRLSAVGLHEINQQLLILQSADSDS